MEGNGVTLIFISFTELPVPPLEAGVARTFFSNTTLAGVVREPTPTVQSKIPTGYQLRH